MLKTVNWQIAVDTQGLPHAIAVTTADVTHSKEGIAEDAGAIQVARLLIKEGFLSVRPLKGGL